MTTKSNSIESAAPPPQTPWPRRALLLAAGTCGLLALSQGCQPGAGQASAPPPPPPTVTVAPVEERPLVEWAEFTGRTEAVESVEVRPRVSGHIREVGFQSGQLVRRGDVLFVIDPRWHQAEFDRRQAEYEQAKVRLEMSEREAARTEMLLEKKAISTEEGDQREARYLEAKANLLAAKAARDTAQLDLDHTEVRAPIDGRVSRALITVGNYVSGQAGAASVLTTLVSTGPIYVYADVDELSLLQIKSLIHQSQLITNRAGEIPVKLQLADEQGFPHEGVIESLDNRVNPQTGSLVLRCLFPNRDNRLLPGLFARIRVPETQERPTLLIAEEAIGTDQAQKYVLTLTPTNTVAYRRVTLGPLVGGQRVVRAGLEAGEQIVVNGLARIRPGMEVVPETSAGRKQAAGETSTAEL